MADRIKGITIEIGGNTTKLTAALQNVNRSLSTSQKALRDVNMLLKFNPKSTELLRQKQEYLKKSVEDTRAKLQQEKDALAQLRASDTTGETVEQQRALERQIADTEGQLKSFERQLKDFGSVGAQQVATVGEKFKDIGGKIENVGSKLTKWVTAPIAGLFTASGKSALSFGDNVAKAATIIDKSVIPVSELSSGLLKLSDDTGKAAGELAEAAYQATSAGVDAENLFGFLETSAKLSKAGFLETDSAVSALTTIINGYQRSMSEADLIADQLVQTQNKGTTTVKELAENIGLVVPTANSFSVPLEQILTAYIGLTKAGVNTANSTTFINSTLTELGRSGSEVSEILKSRTGKTFGQLQAEGKTLGDVLGVLGVYANDDGEAFLNLWSNARAGRGAAALFNADLVTFEENLEGVKGASGNVDAALEDLDTPAARIRKSLNRLKNDGIRMGDTLMPVIDKISDGLEKLLDWWDQLSPKTKETITTALAIAAVVGPVVTIVGTLVTHLGMLLTFAPAITGAFASMGPVIATAFWAIAPVLLPIVGIGAVAIATAGEIKQNYGDLPTFLESCKTELQQTWDDLSDYFVGVAERARQWFEGYKQTRSENAANDAQMWEEIKSNTARKLSELWQNVTGKFEAIRSSIQQKIESARDTVRGAIEAIKGFFNFEWKLPHIKLPHFSITGTGALGLPTIGVDWYAKAMEHGAILKQPTIFGMQNGRLLGGGEAGAEAIVGVGSLQRMIREAVGAGGTRIDHVSMTVNAAPGQDERRIARYTLELLQQEIARRSFA